VLQDKRIDIKFKLAALWLTVFLLFVYGDLLSMWVPSRLDGLLNGNLDGGPTTSGKLLGIGIYITAYALLPLMNLLLAARIGRVLNIVMSVLLIAFWGFILATFSFGPLWNFYIFLAACEMLLAVVIICVSWRWPVAQEAGSSRVE
jgi:hypothetical protein